MRKTAFTAALALISSIAPAQNLESELLWKISGNGLSAPSYLYGTIHMTCDAALDQNVIKALTDTEQLYLELDMDDPNIQTEMMGGMVMKNGITMSSLVSEADFKAVDELLQENLGYSAKLFNNMKPFMITSMLLPAMIDCVPQSVEAELMKITKQQNEDILGLETINEQMAVFDAIPYKEQMDNLVKTAKEGLGSSKEEFRKMMDIYKRKDIKGMLAFMHEADPMYSEHNDVLLTNRNKNWIPRIQKIAGEKPTFFGVGAAHLAGEHGVIMLLRQKGYKVEAVK